MPMTPNEYQKLCSRTSCDQERAADKITLDTPAVTQLLHSMIGLQGELGELSSAFLKYYYYGNKMTAAELELKIKDEIGDILWFVSQGLTACGLIMEEVMEANIRKLKARYPDKFTDEQSTQENRDIEKETSALLNDINKSINIE